MKYEPARKIMISLFVVMYICAIGLWLLPDSETKETLIAPLEPFILYTGLWQTYTVFAPNPRNFNLDLQATIVYRDGSSSVWKYPRMEQMGLLERMEKERFRKYGYDNLNSADNRVLWPDFARYVARLNRRDGNQPALITLERNWADIAAPAVGMGKPLPAHDHHRRFFTYTVVRGDLD